MNFLGNLIGLILTAAIAIVGGLAAVVALALILMYFDPNAIYVPASIRVVLAIVCFLGAGARLVLFCLWLMEVSNRPNGQ